MNEPTAICAWSIIAVTVVYSIVGFRNPDFREKHLFWVGPILAEREYHRLFTSAFLHADVRHLALNMVSFYFFAPAIESSLGPWKLLFIYFAAILGGSLLSLWIHRQHEYRAYGASGGVCGIIFSHIFLVPGGSLVSFPLPVPIPTWLYAILFFLGSFLALRRNTDNVGHDAHLGGAIIGLWTTAALVPSIVQWQPKLFITISVLSVLLFFYVAKNPLFLPLINFLPKWGRGVSAPDPLPRYKQEAIEIDAVLEKISREGMDSLDDREKALLNSASKKYQRRADSQKPKSGLTI